MKLRRPKPEYTISVGGDAFVVDFYVDDKRPGNRHNYLHIHTPNGVLDFKTAGFPFGYLYTAVSRGNCAEVDAFCTLLWRVTQEVYQDPGFANDILRAIAKRDRRLMKQAESDAAKVTEEREEEARVFMEDVAEYADAPTDKERKEIIRRWRIMDKEAIRETKDGHGQTGD